MTANQLADEVMEHYKAEAPRGFNVNWMEEVAIMLRQQAQKIENLLDQYQRLNENLEMWKTGHFKQQAEIEALKEARCVACGWNPNLIKKASEK